MASEAEYVLGTHDEEIVRLGLQHRVWSGRAQHAWTKAGITVGQTVLDVGCGPGYASCELAEIVGPTGRVVALDKSVRFLDSLRERSMQRGLTNISAVELDLDGSSFPTLTADAAWVRWVFAFVRYKRELLQKIQNAMKPGGKLIVHEYFNYADWKLIPRSAAFEEFVGVVMKSWRDEGGEPDVGLDLPVWLSELGFEIVSLRPMIDVISPSNFIWQWPKAFIEVGLRRLVDLNYFARDRADDILNTIHQREAEPHSLMVTPGVLEVIARRAPTR